MEDPLKYFRYLFCLAPWLLTVGTAQALIGGEWDRDSLYPAVVLLQAGTDRRCSASKIGLRTFLTAAHCVVDVERATLAPPFRPGGDIAVTNAPMATSQATAQSLQVELTQLPPTTLKALQRFAAFKQARVQALRKDRSRSEIQQAEGAMQIGHHFTARFPDVAIIRVREQTPEIPVLSVNLEPLGPKDPVTLVGYGCERAPQPGTRRDGPRVARRTWGRSRVIRVDEVNFYTFAAVMRAGSPSLCSGDSGGPVIRDGRVVGVHGTVYGLSSTRGARSNMSSNLNGLVGWDAWPRALDH